MGHIHRHDPGSKLTIFLCLAMLLCISPMPAAAADGDSGQKLSDIVTFGHIGLHYAGENGQAGAEIQDNTLIEKGKQLMLYYTYDIPADKIGSVQADTEYYLEVSPHLVLSRLEQGSPLTIETDTGPVPFGKIYADGSRAWVTFDAKTDGSGKTVLSDYDELNNAFFYLNCGRADTVPPGQSPIEGNSNLYAMKFENNELLRFGYAENEPVEAKAQVKKGGGLTDRTITWTIDYTPWQNPSAADGIAMDTPFELRDTIDAGLHSYVSGSAKIDGMPVTEYPASRDGIDGQTEAYMIAETSGDGVSTVLIFGGTKFNAGAATQGSPAQTIRITYETSIRDELLLPGNAGDQKVQNRADLFAGTDGTFHKLDISGSHTVAIPQPVWLTKTGTTTRKTDGTGSVTDWTVTFIPNGFTFTEDQDLTLYDQLPDGSTLVGGSVKVNGTPVSEDLRENNSFDVSGLKADGQPVSITYQTAVPEEMYEAGTSLGNNTAWFTFAYGPNEYKTPAASTPVGSGDGSGTPGTAVLVKSNDGYRPSDRTISWTVTINPHKADLKSGTFTDDLRTVGGGCSLAGHEKGLEVVGGKDGITVLEDGFDADDQDVEWEYAGQTITVTVKNIGRKTITLQYTTKVCDPCIFANNTSKKLFTNTISTEDMILGSQPDVKRSAKADSTAEVSASVLTKKAPVYDYASGIMEWAVEVDAAELPMTDVVLTDVLPDGLTYIDGSFAAVPEPPVASASAAGQELTFELGDISEKTTIAFKTDVDPEKSGFCSDSSTVRIANTISMEGRADGVAFAEVSHRVEKSFANHGLVKSSSADNRQELIRYEVLVNPFGLALPENPCLVDTLDKRLQLDPDTLLFYKAELSGTTGNAGGKPGYRKVGDAQPLKVSGYDPAANSFTVRLPIAADSRDAYVLAYTADIMELRAGGYSNSVRFDGGAVLLGGNENNNTSVGGGGGGGGGGVAARKASVTITKTDRADQKPLAGVTFTLYEWDEAGNVRGLPFAQGTTDSQGRLSFKVKPGASYELEETKSIPGYGSMFGWEQLPEGAAETDRGLRIRAGAAGLELKLALTNEAAAEDLQWTLTVTKVIRGGTAPLAGAVFGLYEDEDCRTLIGTGISGPDGIISFSGLEKGQRYWLKEITAPAGYSLDAAVYAADETNPAVTIANAPADPDGAGDSGGTDGTGRPGGSGGSGDSGGTDDTGRPGGSGDSGGSGSTGNPSISGDTLPGGDAYGNKVSSDTLRENPAAHSKRQGRGDSTGSPGVPQTGDPVSGTADSAFLFGIFMAVVTLYFVWMGRRGGRKIRDKK